MDASDRTLIDAHLPERLASLVQSLPHLVGVTDGRGNIAWMNESGRRFLGVDDDASLATADIFTDEVFDRYYAEIRPELVAGRSWNGMLHVRRADGSIATVDAVIYGGTGPAGEIQWLATLAVDVSRQLEREAELTHLASHDPLTGLPNRMLAVDRLEVAMAVAKRTGAPIAVIALDLDGFKDVNDRHGHPAGDLVLQQVTARISAAVRPADTVARFGGDEFVVVVHPEESARAAILVAQRIRDQLASPAYLAVGADVRLSASIGLAVAERVDDLHPDDLLRAADRGLYRAKRAGGNCVRVASATDDPADDRLAVIGRELATALSQRQISAGFDPVVDISSRRVLAVEALARWDHPTRGRLVSGDFHDDAAVTGYADLVWWSATRWAVRTALAAGTPYPVDVVAAASQLCSPDVVERFAELHAMAPASKIRVIVSERTLVEVPGTVIEITHHLGELGIDLVLADHGAGGVPLALLAELPVAAVKLDAAITAMARSHPDAVSLASQYPASRGVPCIATQVERHADCELLRTLGVDAVQGRVTGPEWDGALLASSAPVVDPVA